MTWFNTIHPLPFLRLSSFLLALALFMALSILFIAGAQAKIMATSRVELTDPTDQIILAPYIYVTKDPGETYTMQEIARLHNTDERGVLHSDTKLLSLGIDGAIHWMVFSVTNHTDQEEWVLDFGSIYSGRSGFLRKLVVSNDDTQETFISLGGKDGDPILASNMGHASARISLPAKQTSLIVFEVKMDGGSINTIHPVLKSADPYHASLNYSSLLSSLTIVIFLIMTGFFVAVGFIRSNTNYFVFSLFYLLNLSYFTVLDYSFLPGIFVNTHFANLLFFLSLVASCFATKGFLKLEEQDEWENKICIGVLVVFCFAFIAKTFLSPFGQMIDFALFALPICSAFLALSYISFNQSQYGKFGAVPLALAWLMPAFGLLISSLSSNGLFILHPFFMNCYWFSLLIHAGFFIVATIQKIKMLDTQERNSYIVKSKKAVQRAKAIQERETADQAKLLRVIERERELMTGLRELEIHRAEEMRLAKEEADEANRAKSAFLAVVSHEVRTPMTGILGMVKLLLESKLSPKQNEFVVTLQKSGETMMALLNDILDFEKIESGNMELEYIDFNLPQLVRDVVTLMSGHAAGKDLYLKADIDDDCPLYVRGDPTRLRQVLLNLVNNAIKFTEEGGVTVILRAKTINGQQSGVHGDYEIYCGVKDTGIGISQKAQEALFNPFSQADSSISRKYGGTGLGLTICKKLIEGMGSSILIDSEEGKGSVFHFTLLMEKGQSDESQNGQDYKKPKESIPTKRILVVEDNEMNRKVLQGFLENMGQLATMAEDGQKAIQHCSSQAFDLILMDIQLPDMNGIEATAQLRQLKEHHTDRTPIIALTGNVMMEDIKSYYKASMNGFMAKPIDHDALYQMILNVHHGQLDNPFPSPMNTGETAPENIEPFEPNPMETINEDAADLDLDSVAEIDSFAEAIEDNTEKNIEEIVEPSIEHDASQENGKGHDPDDEECLDLIMLNSLMNNLGSTQCKELMDGFLDKANELIDVLEDLKESGDIKAIQARAHELKGMAANFGLKLLSEKAALIEKASKGLKEKEATESIVDLRRYKEQSEILLKSWLEQV